MFSFEYDNLHEDSCLIKKIQQKKGATINKDTTSLGIQSKSHSKVFVYFQGLEDESLKKM